MPKSTRSPKTSATKQNKNPQKKNQSSWDRENESYTQKNNRKEPFYRGSCGCE